MMIQILLSFYALGSEADFQQQNDFFAQAQPITVVELPNAQQGKCLSTTGETAYIRLVKAYKTTEQDLGSGYPRTVREYRFAIYSSNLLAFKARKLLLERDWKNLDALKARDAASTQVSIKDKVQFVYEAKKTNSGSLLLQIRNGSEGRIRLGAEEFEAQENQILYNCEFSGVQ